MNALLHTVEETAEILKVSRWKVFELIRTNQLRSVKIGGSRRIPLARSRIHRTTHGGRGLMPNINEKKRRRRANSEASIYQRASDNKWVGSAYVFTTKGVRKRRPVYGNSFDEVRQKLDELKGASANGVLLPDQNILMRDYLDYWLREIVGQKRATTMRGYQSAVRLHLIPILGRSGWVG